MEDGDDSDHEEEARLSDANARRKEHNDMQITNLNKIDEELNLAQEIAENNDEVLNHEHENNKDHHHY